MKLVCVALISLLQKKLIISAPFKRWAVILHFNSSIKMAKRIILFLFLCTVSLSGFAQDSKQQKSKVHYPPLDTLIVVTNEEIQDSKNDPNPVYLDHFVDEKPKYIEGTDSLIVFISTKLGYEVASSRTENHSVHIQIIIEKDGKVTPENASITGYGITIEEAKSIHESVLNILSSLPEWQPGKKDGKLVRVLVNKEFFLKPKPEEM